MTIYALQKAGLDSRDADSHGTSRLAKRQALLMGAPNNDEGHGIALDSLGHVLVTGTTRSPDFPLGGEMPQKSSLGLTMLPLGLAR